MIDATTMGVILVTAAVMVAVSALFLGGREGPDNFPQILDTLCNYLKHEEGQQMEDQKKTVSVQFYATQEDADTFKEAARIKGMSMNVWILQTARKEASGVINADRTSTLTTSQSSGEYVDMQTRPQGGAARVGHGTTVVPINSATPKGDAAGEMGIMLHLTGVEIDSLLELVRLNGYKDAGVSAWLSGKVREIIKPVHPNHTLCPFPMLANSDSPLLQEYVNSINKQGKIKMAVIDDHLLCMLLPSVGIVPTLVAKFQLRPPANKKETP